MRLKTLFFLCVFALGFCLNAAVTDEDIYKKYKFPIIDKSEVLRRLQLVNNRILKGDEGTPLNSVRFTLEAAEIGKWAKFAFIEVDTDISRDWYTKVYKLLAYMGTAKKYIEKQRLLNRTKRPTYTKAVSNFYVAYKKFAELVKNPEKPDPKMLRKLKKQKKDWMKKAREKMRRAKGIR